MSSRISIAVICAVGFAVPAAAHDPKTSGEHITLTGCIERSDQLPVGTSGNSADIVTGYEYVVMHILPRASSAPAKVPNGYTEPARLRLSPIYALDENGSSLEPLIGQRVEVHGILEPAGTTYQAARRGVTTTAPATIVTSDMPVLRVTSIGMVTPSCR
jgi:hypothetical protein